MATLHDGLGISDIPVYKSTFIKARKLGEAEQYFQSQHLSHDCAESIRDTVWAKINATQGKQDDSQLDYDFITKYAQSVWVTYLMKPLYIATSTLQQKKIHNRVR